MKKLSSFFLAVAISIVIQPAISHAQPIDDGGLWFALFANGDLNELGGKNERLKYWFDAHLRLLDDADGFNQSIVRPGIGLDMGNDSAIWAGYGWIRTTPLTGGAFDEHRIWQQQTWSPSRGDIAYLFRSRFEQRLVERGNDIGFRWRQFFRAQKTIRNCPTVNLVAWDELFFHLNDTDWGTRTGFDQNRVFVGMGFKRFSDSKWRTEVGYLNQTINLPGDNNRTNHILSINLFR